MDLARELAQLAHRIGRQIGLLITRRGEVEAAVVGSRSQIELPPLPRFRVGEQRLRGLRYLHTHLDDRPLSGEDLADLASLRLDLVAAIACDGAGQPQWIHAAHLLPPNPEKKQWAILPPVRPDRLALDCQQLIRSLEEEWRRALAALTVPGHPRALLVDARRPGDAFAEESLDELRDLARESGVTLADCIIQQRDKPDPKFVVGQGKLKEITLRAHQEGAELLIFNQNLTPSQVRHVGDQSELKVLDRTQLILDIFAQRARSRDGKIQVELAQLKYSLPRLGEKDDMLSRLTGGIGGRGPGETKMEIDRRRVREKIHRLEREIERLSRSRAEARRRRERGGVPVVSIIGYTNAGKSTLLNTLTESRVLAQDQPFSTLDPSSKRLRFPRDRELIITDTVGFIRDLPQDLITAFRATLEELREADLLLHVIDISNPHFEVHIQVVEKLLEELKIAALPRLLLFNKCDRADPRLAGAVARRYAGFAVCALDRETLRPLLARMEVELWREGKVELPGAAPPYPMDEERS